MANMYTKQVYLCIYLPASPPHGVSTPFRCVCDTLADLLAEEEDEVADNCL